MPAIIAGRAEREFVVKAASGALSTVSTGDHVLCIGHGEAQGFSSWAAAWVQCAPLEQLGCSVVAAWMGRGYVGSG